MLDPENYPQALNPMQSRWTPDQVKLQQWLALPSRLRTPTLQKELAAQIGVDESTLWRWKQQPGFMDAVSAIIKAELQNEVPEIMAVLVREAKAGKIEAIRDCLAIAQFYNHHRDAAVSVNVVPQMMDPHKARRLAEYADRLEEESGPQDPPTFPFGI